MRPIQLNALGRNRCFVECLVALTNIENQGTIAALMAIDNEDHDWLVATQRILAREGWLLSDVLTTRPEVQLPPVPFVIRMMGRPGFDPAKDMSHAVIEAPDTVVVAHNPGDMPLEEYEPGGICYVMPMPAEIKAIVHEFSGGADSYEGPGA